MPQTGSISIPGRDTGRTACVSREGVFVLDDCPEWLEHPARMKVPRAAAQRNFIFITSASVEPSGGRALRSRESPDGDVRDGGLFFMPHSHGGPLPGSIRLMQ
jgi:hypothetical protein